MANKYNSAQACYDVHQVFLAGDNHLNTVRKAGPNLDYLTEELGDFALGYLKLAAEKGHSGAKYKLGKYYLEGKYVPRDTLLGNILLLEWKHLK